MHDPKLIPAKAAVITKSDTAEHNLIGFYVGGTGDVNVMLVDGTQCLFSSCPVGLQVGLVIKRIMSTSTTATLIVGFRA